MKTLRRLLPLLLMGLLFFAPRAMAADKRLTLMIYVCGSNLESDGGSASADIQEILDSGFNTDEVSVLIMTGGSSYWSMGYDPAQICISEVGRRGMRVVWRSEAMNMGESETLTQLLSFGTARRTMSHPAASSRRI